ncbi:hypothetical protein CRG98_036214 [Punica granatum]|nr:hypothetical protein CRG98_036214 [Punica granatum]
MGLDKDAMLKLHGDLLQALRVNYYPTCQKPDEVVGVSPHSDTSIITILLQSDETEGLQIQHDGMWIPVKPIPDALVVNVGDVLEIWTNGKYKSIEHRVVTNEKKPRISLASFIAPLDDMEIEPLDHMVDQERPCKMYKKVKYGEYLRHSMNRKMEGKAHTQMAKA